MSPLDKPMPDVETGCHELRLVDGNMNWRIMCYVASDAIVILDVFQKKSTATPKSVIADCRKRLAGFQRATRKQKGKGRARR